MQCPKCFHNKTIVKDSRPQCDHIWRVRACANCGHRWETVEIDEDYYEWLIQRTNERKE
jgi:transcriptional regulator NrdR family protein